MFIPNIKPDGGFNVGDIVICTEIIRAKCGFFTIGHEFTITKCNANDYSIVDNIENVTINGINKSHPDLSIIINYKDAYNIVKKREREREIKKHIVRYCHHKLHKYFDRESYTACDLDIGKYSYAECSPHRECMKHMLLENINKSDLLKNILREEKIKSIKSIKKSRDALQ